MKHPDEDIQRALAWIESEAEFTECVDDDDGEIALDVRRVETVFRRLAREAGYDISVVDTQPIAMVRP